MDQSTLLALRFDINAGGIDRGGKCYGRMTSDGIEWTEEGRALLDELVVDEAPRAQKAPAPRAQKAPKAPAAVPSVSELLGTDAE